MPQIHKFRFPHGLGDHSNAAHLFELWRRRDDKFILAVDWARWIWESLNYTCCDNASATHPWPEPNPARREFLHCPWDGNKSGRNLAEYPLGFIGSQDDLWKELVQVRFDLDDKVPQRARDKVNRFLDKLPRPWIVWHSRGQTSPEKKNPHHDLETNIGQHLLDLGTVIYPEFASGKPEFKSYRFRPGRFELPELYWLIRSADVFVGVDSGPFHFARFTRTPRVGLWWDIYYWHACIPSPETVNVQAVHGNTPYKRFDFNSVEVPKITGEKVAQVVNQVLGPRKFARSVGADVTLQNLLPNLRHRDSDLTTVVDRDQSFKKLFGFLKDRERPKVLETGCQRSVDDWGAGSFTTVCGYMLRDVGGHLTSVDITPENVSFARTWTNKLPVTVVQADSVTFLQNYTGEPFDAVYLDSLDTQQPGHAEHCVREVRSAITHLKAEGYLVIDDSPWDGTRWTGKGALAIPWLLEQGWRLVFSGYQAILTK